GEVRGAGGPGAVGGLRDVTAQVGPDAPVLLGGHEQVIPSLLAADAHALEAEQGGVEVLDGRVPDQDLAAGYGGQADEAADLDVVAADPEPAAAQAIDALELENARPDPGDLRTELDQHVAQVLDVRLGGGVADPRVALRHDGRHDRVLRRGHARLVEEDVGTTQAGRGQRVAVIRLDLCAELRQREEMRIHATPPDHVAARRRQRHATH